MVPGPTGAALLCSWLGWGRSGVTAGSPFFNRAAGTESRAAQAEQHLASIAHVTAEGEFTVRDEANALTAFAFRNGFLEDLHAGKSSSALSQPGYSRISDDEMRRLMIEASAKLADMLRLKQEDPAKCEVFIRDYQRRYCWRWER